MAYSPQRVVSLQPSATVILRDIGKLDALVACTKYCIEVCPEIGDRGLTIVADSWTAQALQIVALGADLVIASVPYQEKAIAEIMKSGTRFLGFAPKSLSDIYGDIAAIAGIMNMNDCGQRIIAHMQLAIEAVREKTSGLPRHSVFCEEWGKPLIASQKWVAELVEAAGGEFVGTPGAQTDFATLAKSGPDIMIAAWCGAGDRVPLEKIVEQRNWRNLPAVRNGRVYCIRDEYLNTPAPTLIQGLHALAAAIHPECFQPPAGLRSIAINEMNQREARPMKRVVAALIWKSDKILICQRTRHQTMPLKWEFPGGKIEEGEQPRDALRRELDEELGITATIGDEVARIQHRYPTGNSVELRFFDVREYSGEIENRIFKDIVWANPAGLPEYDFLEADMELIQKLVREGSGREA